MYAWGGGWLGVLGTGSSDDCLSPTRVAFLCREGQEKGMSQAGGPEGRSVQSLPLSLSLSLSVSLSLSHSHNTHTHPYTHTQHVHTTRTHRTSYCIIIVLCCVAVVVLCYNHVAVACARRGHEGGGGTRSPIVARKQKMALSPKVTNKLN